MHHDTHSSTLQPHKLSIRKNKELMQQSKMQGTRNPTSLNSARETPTPQNTFARRAELLELSRDDKFIFNAEKMEVDYGCGCLSLSSCTRSEIYISPSQVISRRLLTQEGELFKCQK
jgi:hypothetical protein